MIAEFIAKIRGIIFSPKVDESGVKLPPFAQYLDTLGEDKVRDAIERFKGDIAYNIFLEFFLHAQNAARGHLMACDPEDKVVIAYCQVYGSLVDLFDGLVDNLSLEDLDRQMKEHLKLEDTVEAI